MYLYLAYRVSECESLSDDNYENMKQTGRTSKCKFGIFEEQHIGGQNDIFSSVSTVN